MSKKEIKISEVEEKIKKLNLIEKRLVEKNQDLKGTDSNQIDYVTDLKHLLSEFFILSLIEKIKYDFKELSLFVKETRDRTVYDLERMKKGELRLYMFH